MQKQTVEEELALQAQRNYMGTDYAITNNIEGLGLLLNNPSIGSGNLKTILDTVPSGIVVVNAEGKFIYINKRAKEIYGTDLSGKDLEAHIPHVKALKPSGEPMPPEERPVTRSLKHGESVRNIKLILENAGGERYSVVVSSASLRDGQGNINGAVVTFEDIAGRKNAEEALAESEEKHSQEINERNREEKHERFVWNFLNEIASMSSSKKILRRTCQALGEHLRVGNVHMADMDEETDTARAFQGFTDQTVPPLEGEWPNVSSFWHPEMTAAFRNGMTVVVRNAQHHPWTIAEKYAPTGVAAFVTIPFIEEGVWRHFISVISAEPRDWREDEIRVAERVTKGVFPHLQRARASEELRESEARFKQMAETINSAFWISEFDGTSNLRYIYMSPAFERIFCIPVEHIYNDPQAWLKLIHPEDSERFLTAMKRRAMGVYEETPDFRIVKSGGAIHWIKTSLFPIKNQDGKILRYVGIADDITERKKIEENMTFHAHTLASLQEAICAVDENFNITFWNGMAEELFGWTAQEAIGSPSKEIFKMLSPNREESIENILNNIGYAGEAIFRNKDGKEVHTSAICSIMRDARGNYMGNVSSFRDITERKHAEELLEKSNEALVRSIEMKDEFLSLISHEFRTPLTVIISAIQMLKTCSWNELSDKAKGYFNTIRQNSNRQLKLVNNILDLTKVNAGSFEVHKINSDIVQLTKLIIESIGPYADRKKIRVSFTFDPAEIIIGIDEEKYERILLNLLSNAIKYTPKGELITIKLSKKIVKNKSMVCAQVCDSGIGIPADKLEHIFERFGQVDSSLSRQTEGTGIGLHLTRMFVEMLGGEIRADSKLGRGSTFTVLIPAIKVRGTHSETMLPAIADNRTIQLTEIEFSDIYLDK